MGKFANDNSKFRSCNILPVGLDRRTNGLTDGQTEEQSLLKGRETPTKSGHLTLRLEIL